MSNSELYLNIDTNTILVVLKYRKRVEIKVNLYRRGVKKGRVKSICLLFVDDSTSRPEKRSEYIFALLPRFLHLASTFSLHVQTHVHDRTRSIAPPARTTAPPLTRQVV